MRRAARAAKLWCSEARDLGLSVDAQSDPGEFMMWLLHTLHQDLSGKKKGGKSIINRCFQGELEVTTVGGDADAAPDKMPFYMLALDLPPAPLFQAGSSSTSIRSRAAQHTCYFEAAAALRRPPPPSALRLKNSSSVSQTPLFSTSSPPMSTPYMNTPRVDIDTHASVKRVES